MSDNYVGVHLTAPNESKLRKLAKTGKISFTANDLKGSSLIYLHPANAKLVNNAKKMGKGVNSMSLSGGEIQHNLNVNGGSIFGMLKSLGSTVYKGLTSPTGKKILGALADVAVPALVNHIGLPADANDPARDVLRNITGIGLKEKRLLNLIKARQMKQKKKSGGSFLIS